MIPNISNASLSVIYKDRLEELRRSHEKTAPFHRGRVIRKWLRKEIGCHASFLSTPSVKPFLKDWDDVRGGKTPSDKVASSVKLLPEPSQRPTEVDDLTYERIRREQARKRRDDIEWGEARVGRKIRKCPMVTFNNVFQSEIYSWQCIRVRIELPDSLWDSAKIMLQFFRWLRRERLNWVDVDDDDILEFREHLRSKRDSKEHVNKVVGVIHSFYRHQELTGRLKYRVQVYQIEALPEEMRDYEFPIKSELRIHVSKRGVKTSSWVSPWLLKGKESSYGKKATPTDDVIEIIHQLLHNTKHGLRNSAMLSAYEDCGGRRKEVQSIKVAQLPTPQQLHQLLITGDEWVIEVTRKGQDEEAGETAPLRFRPVTAMRLLSYVNGPRAAIVRNTGSATQQLFLKDNGKVLQLDSVTKLVTKVLREAGFPNSTLHKLRSRYIKNKIKVRLDTARAHAVKIGPASNWTETILSGAAIDMNHSTTESLQPYMYDIFAEETANGGPETLENLQHRIRESQRILLDIQMRLAGPLEFDRILREIEVSPRRDEIFKRLSTHAGELLRAA
ncbi:site-specific integrase [Rhizobium leguminosarum]|uniref:site-specific integrase n=1 Tax=Rhizobium leguminosarum TaxID=384 RepID=UPI001039E47A|nr:site-specific integrase [Rhizobium leguminosarum]TCA57159.1 site-specific integrase [Rhizobium leguminosarum bv. viciae]TCB22078.1 site-specific integrase [Rhizobium leguminosarum bv. viciae]